MDIDGGPPVPPTPLFERLVSEEVQELKSYSSIIANQSRRLAELERVHINLEQRLELLTKERMELEATMEDRERNWSSKFALLEKEKDESREEVKVERKQNEKLVEQLNRKNQDIRRMLVRKVSKNTRYPIQTFRAGCCRIVSFRVSFPFLCVTV